MENEQNIPKQLEETTQPTMGGGYYEQGSRPATPTGNRIYEAIKTQIFGPPNEDGLGKMVRFQILLIAAGIGFGVYYIVKKTKNK